MRMSDEYQATGGNLDEQTAELVRQGVEALKSGNTLVARALLSEVTRLAPGYQDAWLWLSDIAESTAERETFLRTAIDIDPHTSSGQIARRKLDELLEESGAVVEPAPPLEDAEAEDEEPPWWKRLTPIQLGLGGLAALALLLLCGLLAMRLFGSFFARREPVAPPQPTPIAVTAAEIVMRLQQAGAEAADPRPAVPEDFGGLTPRCLDNAQRFFTPSLPFPAGGLALVCPTAAEAQLAKAEFDALGVQDPARRSWTYLNNNVLLQVDGRLPPEQAVRYEQVIANLGATGGGSVLPPTAAPPTAVPGATPIPVQAFDVYNRIAATGVDVANPRPAVPQDFGTVPPRCLENSVRYFIPSLGDPAGGVIVVCANANDAIALKNDYDAISSVDPARRSWTFLNNNAFVQADGRLPEDQARKFAEVVAALSTGQPVAPLPPTPQPEAPILPISALEVFNRVQVAGIEATDPRVAVPEDFGLIQPRCLNNSVRYFIPSLGFPAGGIILSCPSAAEAQAAKAAYDQQSAANPTAASWTFLNNNIFAQADGRLPQIQAQKFAEVIAALGTDVVVPPLPPTQVPPTATPQIIPTVPVNSPVPTATPGPIPPTVPVNTPVPTDTPPPAPTDTPVPPPTTIPLPTDTPVPPPTDTPLPLPTDTPLPLPTDTPLPTIVIPPTSTTVPYPSPRPLPEQPIPDPAQPQPSPRANGAPFPGVVVDYQQAE